MPPALCTFIDGEEWTRVECPELGARAWALGVVSVQLGMEGGRLVGQVRAHVTGAPAPEIVPLTRRALIQVQLVDEDEAPLVPPSVSAPELAGAAARMSLQLDDEPLDIIALPPQSPDGTRAFGHVFCRWLRSGAYEPGFDLTDFLHLPPGKMYERRIHRPLILAQTVSYSFDKEGK